MAEGRERRSSARGGRRLPTLPGGLGAKLALAFSLLLAIVGVAAFLAIDRATRSELEGRIDADLEEQYVEFLQQTSERERGDPQRLERSAEAFLRSQRYHAASRIFVIEVGPGRQVTSHPDVIAEEVEHELEEGEEEEDEDSGLLRAPEGLADVSTEETGELRALTRAITAGGERVGTFRVADPLASVTAAEQELRNAFLVAGGLALAVGILVAILVAGRITAPLRQVADVAATVEAGDLTPRLEARSNDEVGRLARSFNGMLDRLERAFERERAFVSDASHELRTPLTVLRGQVDLLQRLDDDREERRRILEILPREIERMGRLVDEMLTLARAEDGRLLERREVELADLLADVERDAPLLGERDYRFEGRRDGRLNADPERLSQVFRNLIRNAVQHSAVGDPVTITVHAMDGRIEIAVADNGPGIPPDELPRVFERFHRVDASRARDRGGSGLGLPIARAIVEAHGGQIWAESSPGGGTTIRFELPGYRSAPR